MNASGRIAKWIAWAFGVLVIAVASVVTWMLSTTSGARWTVARAGSVVGDKLAIGSTEGTIAGPLELRDLRYLATQDSSRQSVDNIGSRRGTQ